MAFSLSRWRPRHLLLAWVAYWLLLLATVMRPAIQLLLSAMNASPGRASVSASMGDGALSLVVQSGGSTWTGAAPYVNVALWIAGPPLLLFALWVATRPRTVAPRERVT
jgi:hypothetical protein